MLLCMELHIDCAISMSQLLLHEDSLQDESRPELEASV